jgi:glycosyltransferase involved in cell wall biosynthesis
LSMLSVLPSPLRATSEHSRVVDTMSAPKVSICVPTYNGEAYLRECLDSALGQTFEDFELLIVDDASSDLTGAIAAEYSRADSRIRFFQNPTTLGLVGNWNRCIELARGEWIKFLFQDDRLESHCLMRMLMARVAGVFLIACRRTPLFDPTASMDLRRTYANFVDEHNLPRRFPGSSVVTAQSFSEHMVDYPFANCIGEPTATMIHRDAFRLYGTFHPYFIQIADWEYEARVAVHTGLCYVDEPLATFRVHAASSSAVNLSAGRRYRFDVIDPLLILHEIVYAPAYRAVREAASRRKPRKDFQRSLLWAVDRAQILVLERHDAAEWKEAAARYPKLLSAPPARRVKRWLTSLALSMVRRFKSHRGPGAQ